jgi:hypothetical protein
MRVEGDGTAGGRSAAEARFNQLYAHVPDYRGSIWYL